MLFASIEFTIFLPVVFIIYWSIPQDQTSKKNFLLLSASYFFYGWWDWRFLILIIGSSCIDYFVSFALESERENGKRKTLLAISILANLGLLLFFKYYNFFLDSFVEGFSFFGKSFDLDRLDIVLPVGISFYTFQTLSYTIDVYRGKVEPKKDIIAFFTFVSFFPQLVAGPIERAKNLLPQFYSHKRFNSTLAIDGLRQILWGLFKKVVIADGCAKIVDEIFINADSLNGSTLFLGAIYFSFQIYCDFSGYSDVAIGTSKLFGFRLMRNFNFPYFSRSIPEFWKRWHISLSSWFKDYLYIPLGGSWGGTALTIRNIFIVFIVSGLWHGANWTFVVWGFIHALYFLPSIFKKSPNHQALDGFWNKSLRASLITFSMLRTYSLVTIGWIFFRSPDIGFAIAYLSEVFSSSIFYLPTFYSVKLLAFIGGLVLLEGSYLKSEFVLDVFLIKGPRAFRWAFYSLLITMNLYYFDKPEDFIYFQF